MHVFSDAQGQQTPLSVVRSGRKSNSSELVCIASLPASIKKIGLKDISAGIFFSEARATSPIMRGRICQDFELIHDFMHVVVT